MGERKGDVVLKSWCRRLICLGIIVGLVTFAACAKKQEAAPNPLTEAYSLMDKGQNAKAILILEDAVARDPHNSEARVLLASAYLGEAGVDVYKIHDAFKDVLFDKSLGDSFWHGPSGSKDPSTGLPSFEGVDTSPDKTPVELVLTRLDFLLMKLRQDVTFLNRFPDVEKIKWSLLDKALEHLDSVESEKDVCLYRVFVRIIYLRAYLSQEIIADPDFGSKKWACNLDVEKLRESLVWIARNLVGASDDFRQVYPGKASSFLAGFQGTITAFLEALEHAKSDDPAGANTGDLGVQQRLREAFKCDKTGDT